MKNVNDLSSKSKRDDALEDVSTRISKFKGEIETAAHDAGRNIKDYYEEKRSELNELADDLTAHVRRKPLQATLAAAAVGYILARLFRR